MSTFVVDSPELRQKFVSTLKLTESKDEVKPVKAETKSKVERRGSKKWKIIPRRRKSASTKSKEVYEDFVCKQQHLQEEATMALAKVRPMAHMQLEVDNQHRKKPSIAETVGIPGFSDGKKKKLSEKSLHDMNLAQLQVVVNDLHTQIETLNEELVGMLSERDDLHMQQDSMLINSEDLLAKAQDVSQNILPPPKWKKMKSSRKSQERKEAVTVVTPGGQIQN